MTEEIFEEIKRKRNNHEKLGYDAQHDDQHTPMEFMQFEQEQIVKAWTYGSGDYDRIRDRFLEIAAVAVAAIESIDRKQSKNTNPTHFNDCGDWLK